MNAYEHPWDEGYEDLANAIVKEAFRDYQKILSALLKDPDDTRKKHLLAAKMRLEDFFYSDWFEVLTDLDPASLVQKVTEKTIRNEREKAERRIRKLQEAKEKREKGLI